MSAAARQAIADAASSVEGVRVFPYFRQVSRAGSGYVELERRQRADNGFGFVDTWSVLIVTPSEASAAGKYVDRVWPLLAAALAPQARVESMAPYATPNGDGGTSAAVLIQLIREAD